MSQPASANQLVALVGAHHDLRSLLELVLADWGYATCAYALDEPGLLERLVQARPKAIVVEVPPGPRARTILDDLSATPATSAIPVIALGGLASVQEQAKASGNVYAVLPVPFALRDLQEAVAGALAGMPFDARIQAQPVETDPAFGQAADLLLRAERDIRLG